MVVQRRVALLIELNETDNSIFTRFVNAILTDALFSFLGLSHCLRLKF